jgi:hypothetical protein
VKDFFKTPRGLLLWPMIGLLIVISLGYLGHQMAGNNPIIISISIMLSAILMVVSKIDGKKELRTISATNIATILATITFATELPEWLAIAIDSVAVVLFCFVLAKSWEIAKDDIVYQKEEWPWLRRWVTLLLFQVVGVGWITYSILKNPDNMSKVWILEAVILTVAIIVWVQLSARYRENEASSDLVDWED